MPVNHESPVREGLIIKRSAQRTAASVGYAQKLACEIVCNTMGLEKLSAEDVEIIENSALVPAVLSGLAELSLRGDEKTADFHHRWCEHNTQGAKSRLIRSLIGTGAGAAAGAGGGYLKARKRREDESEEEHKSRKRKSMAVGGGIGAAVGGGIGAGSKEIGEKAKSGYESAKGLFKKKPLS
jgi:hypothetical protein